jgi:hypothetical protein
VECTVTRLIPSPSFRLGLNRIPYERFAPRLRPYTRHNARALSLPLMHECALAFGRFFAATPRSRFRGSHTLEGEFEVNSIFIHTHFVIERHREALLWSWVVGRWGWGGGGRGMRSAPRGGYELVMDRRRKRKMWRELGGKEGRSEVRRRAPRRGRSSLAHVEKNLRAAGVRGPWVRNPTWEGTTRYSWGGCSATSGDETDIFGIPRDAVSLDTFNPTWNPDLLPLARIDRAKCLGPDGELAWDMFRRLVRDATCGDNSERPSSSSTLLIPCPVILALTYSTRSGLGMFLPPPLHPTRIVDGPAASREPQPITLPLVLPTKMPALPANPRLFALRLLQRYAHTLGSSPDAFLRPTSARSVRKGLAAVDAHRQVLMFGINDDLPEAEGLLDGTGLQIEDWDPKADVEVKKADAAMATWFEKRWPATESLECERWSENQESL